MYAMSIFLINIFPRNTRSILFTIIHLHILGTMPSRLPLLWKGAKYSTQQLRSYGYRYMTNAIVPEPSNKSSSKRIYDIGGIKDSPHDVLKISSKKSKYTTFLLDLFIVFYIIREASTDPYKM